MTNVRVGRYPSSARLAGQSRFVTTAIPNAHFGARIAPRLRASAAGLRERRQGGAAASPLGRLAAGRRSVDVTHRGAAPRVNPTAEAEGVGADRAQTGGGTRRVHGETPLFRTVAVVIEARRRRSGRALARRPGAVRHQMKILGAGVHLRAAVVRGIVEAIHLFARCEHSVSRGAAPARLHGVTDEAVPVGVAVTGDGRRALAEAAGAHIPRAAAAAAATAAVVTALSPRAARRADAAARRAHLTGRARAAQATAAVVATFAASAARGARGARTSHAASTRRARAAGPAAAVVAALAAGARAGRRVVTPGAGVAVRERRASSEHYENDQVELGGFHRSSAFALGDGAGRGDRHAVTGGGRRSMVIATRREP